MPDIHLLTDDKFIGRDNLLETLVPAIEAGIEVLQLRFKHLAKGEFYVLGQRLKPLLKQHGVKFLINDHIDIALALEADGVHIGQDDLPYEKARALMGKNKIVGLSLSSLNEFQACKHLDADYFGVGPVSETLTKEDASPVLSAADFRSITENSPLPIIAIGGIDAHNAHSFIENGASGVAVCSAICNSPNPALATRTIRSQL